MNFKKLTICILAASTCITGASYANEVQLSATKPMSITYRLAYQDTGKEPVLSEPQSIQIDKDIITIPVRLDNHTVAGIVFVSADGHVIPDSHNRFNQPNQCSVTTNLEKTSGTVIFIREKNQMSCKIQGGIFG